MSVITLRRTSRSVSALAVTFALGLPLAAGCGGPQTSVTQVWKAQLSVPPIKSALVFGARMDETNRRVVEDALVAELKAHGVAARAAYELFPSGPPDRERAREAVKQAGFEGVVVATLRNVSDRTTVVPGASYGGFWNSYYGESFGYYDPGYVQTDRVVTFETTLWDARAEDRLVWSANLETTNPSAGAEFAKSLTDGVVSSLAKSGLLPR